MPLAHGQLEILPQGVVSLSADGSSLCGGSVAGSGQLACRAAGAASGADAVLQRDGCDGYVTARSSRGAAVFSVKAGALTPEESAQDGLTSSGCFPGPGGGPLAAAASATDAGVAVRISSVGTGAVVKQATDASLRRATPGGGLLGVARVFGVVIGGEAGRVHAWRPAISLRPPKAAC
jgi:hypothetical protein